MWLGKKMRPGLFVHFYWFDPCRCPPQLILFETYRKELMREYDKLSENMVLGKGALAILNVISHLVGVALMGKATLLLSAGCNHEATACEIEHSSALVGNVGAFIVSSGALVLFVAAASRRNLLVLDSLPSPVRALEHDFTIFKSREFRRSLLVYGAVAASGLIFSIGFTLLGSAAVEAGVYSAFDSKSILTTMGFFFLAMLDISVPSMISEMETFNCARRAIAFCHQNLLR